MFVLIQKPIRNQKSPTEAGEKRTVGLSQNLHIQDDNTSLKNNSPGQLCSILFITFINCGTEERGKCLKKFVFFRQGAGFIPTEKKNRCISSRSSFLFLLFTGHAENKRINISSVYIMACVFQIYSDECQITQIVFLQFPPLKDIQVGPTLLTVEFLCGAGGEDMSVSTEKNPFTLMSAHF